VDTASRLLLARQAEAFAHTDTIDAEPFAGILERRAPVQRTWQGPVFVCEGTSPCAPEIVRITETNADLLAAYLSAWLPDVPTSEFMFATVVDGHAVAVCSSVRVTSEAHEAGVETAPDFRRRGYAAKSVLAWAAAIRGAGYSPLYSTSWQNAASRAVAARANLRRFGSDFHIT
ncbi:MAG: GNAT family N-acetyltransferase, partial [Longimicrobiales bacterium]